MQKILGTRPTDAVRKSHVTVTNACLLMMCAAAAAGVGLHVV